MEWLETRAVNAPPQVNIQQELTSQSGSPVHHHAIWDDSDVEDDQECNQEAGQNVAGRSLRTKDHHHLKLPPIPESAANYRAWRDSVRTALLAFDRKHGGPFGTLAFESFHGSGGRVGGIEQGQSGTVVISQDVAGRKH